MKMVTEIFSAWTYNYLTNINIVLSKLFIEHKKIQE